MKRLALLLALALCACTHTDNTPQKKYSFIDTFGFHDAWTSSQGADAVKVHIVTIREYAEHSRLILFHTIDRPEKGKRYTYTADPRTEYCTVGIEYRVGNMTQSTTGYVNRPFILAEGSETILEMNWDNLTSKEEPLL